ncbi:metal ABC transporter solute-binding protein, Zn/Mn family [Litorivivens sp.]|uniref:metal ABC transporter solute-binding protein, Zn/Mn family n=1 Tax=Litorivivens sp. TaxID=2020868 RepID=UPI0035694173
MTRYRLVIAVLVLLTAPGAVLASTLTVLSSVKPIQMLVSAVGGDNVDSQLLLPPAFSPHDARLKPSQWQALEKANLIVWVGPELERFLASAMRDRENVLPLGVLAGEAIKTDPHIWLSVDQVVDMTTTIAKALARKSPRHEAGFLARAARLISLLRQEDLLLRQQFTRSYPPYLLPHRGYTHFEQQYGLAPAAIVSPGGDHLPGAAHIVALRSRLLAGEFRCVFREPQHDGKLMQRLLDGVEVQQITLDPMGAGIEGGSDAFVRYYLSLAEAFLACRE